MKLYKEKYDCYLNIDRYQYNNRLYLGLETDEELFCDITINLPELSLDGDGTIFLNDDLPREVREQLEKNGILSNYLYSVNYNYGRYDCYSVNLDKLKYYDPIGFDNSNIKLDEVKDLDSNIKI